MKYRFAGLILDTDKKQLFSEGNAIHLPKKSYELLHLLLANPDTTFSRSELIEHLWDGRVVTENTVDQCISKLRKSLSSAQPGDYIESVYGHGIKLGVAVKTVQKGGHEIAPASSKSEQKLKWLLPLVSVSLLILAGLWWWQEKQPSAEQPGFNPVVKKPIEEQARVQWLPARLVKTAQQASDANDPWLNNGAAFYLQQRMAEYANLRLQIPKKTGYRMRRNLSHCSC